MEIKRITSEKGKDLLLVDGFTYRKLKVLRNGECFWSCTKSSCNAKIFTLSNETTISRSDTEHNHENDVKKLNRKIISNSAKSKVKEDVSERPSTLIRKAIEETPSASETLTRKDITYIHRNVYNRRRKLITSLPKSHSEAISSPRASDLVTPQSEPGILISDGQFEIKKEVPEFSEDAEENRVTEESQVIEETSFDDDAFVEETGAHVYSVPLFAPSSSYESHEASQNVAARTKSRSKKGGPMYKVTEFYNNIDAVTRAVNALQKIAEKVCAPQPAADEFEVFGKMVAANLRQLSINRASQCQLQIMQYLVQTKLSETASDLVMSTSHIPQLIPPSPILSTSPSCLVKLPEPSDNNQ